MHKLDRHQPPRSLSKFRHGQHNWSNLSHQDRQEIWQQLEAMQGIRCAYCEDALRGNNRHIEHFYQRSRNPALTFFWDNLFGSCNKPDSCGKYKDRQDYDPKDLIKPDIDDPEACLHFLSDGRIIPRAGLCKKDRNKAEVTLRVFNLDHDRGPLRSMRKSAVTGYIFQAEELAEFAGILDASEFDQYLSDELAAITHLPFATAIKQVLTGFLP